MVGEGLVQDLVRRGGENALVEHLAVLLGVPELAARFLALAALDASGAIKVDTQVHDPETRARPDIVLTSSTATIWVEAKLDAALTDKQPGVYLDVLHQLGPGRGHLVVLAKSSRWVELAQTLRERVGHPPGTERTFMHQGVPVTQITWREVRDTFNGVSLSDPVAGYLLSEFISGIDQYVERTTVPYTPEMATVIHDTAALRAWAALEDLLQDLRDALEAQGCLTQNQPAAELQQTGYFVSPEGDEDRMVWIGLLARAGVAWPGRGPLWAWLYGDAFDHEGRVRAAGFEIIDPGCKLPDWAACALVPLTLDGANSAEVVHGLHQQLRRLWGSSTEVVPRGGSFTR